MANLRDTSSGGLGKYIAPVIAMIQESMKGSKKLKTTVKANNVLVKNNAANKKSLKSWQELASNQSTEKEAKELVLETDKGDVKFGQLWKPNVNVNMGDMAEGVFAAAIAARFKNKNKPITTTDVFDVLKAFKANGTNPTAKGKKGLKGVITFDSPNKNPKVIDKVTLTIALAEVNMKGLLDPQAKLSLMTVASGVLTVAGEVDATSLDISGDADIDGTTNLDNTDIDGSLTVDGAVDINATTFDIDASDDIDIDTSDTTGGIAIGTANSGVPVSIGHSTSEVTVGDNLTVTGDLTVSGTTTTVNSTTVSIADPVF